MKTKYSFLSLVFLLVFTCVTYAQQTITLVCNSERLSEESPTEACYFVGGEGVNPEEFTTYATVGEEITWVGESSTEDDTIDITMIKIKRGRNIFDSDELPGERSVIGQIMRATPEDDPYVYRIFFKVNSTGKNYQIDPIIKVKDR